MGVYANSPKKDIIANKGKANAFLKVNRSVDFPLNLKGILPSISRTVEMLNEAESHLTIAKEYIDCINESVGIIKLLDTYKK